MAAFPSNIYFQIAGYGRQAATVIVRSETERGPAKTRRIQSDPVVTVSGKLYFRTSAAEAAFDTWFFSKTGANAGAGWFDWTDPRDGTVRQARVVSLGALNPLSSNFGFSEQQIELEYVRAVTA